MVKSTIVLDDVRIYAYHGVMEQERRVGGWYSVSLRVHYNITRALENDNVDDTLNYAQLLDVVKKEMSVSSNLVEHVAGRIAKAVYTAFDGVGCVEVKLLKLNPPMGAECAGAGVELEMSFEQH